MELGSRDALLTVLTGVALLVGAVLVLVGGPTVTVVGILLIVAGSLVFIVDAKDLVVKTDENARR